MDALKIAIFLFQRKITLELKELKHRMYSLSTI